MMSKQQAWEHFNSGTLVRTSFRKGEAHRIVQLIPAQDSHTGNDLLVVSSTETPAPDMCLGLHQVFPL